MEQATNRNELVRLHDDAWLRRQKIAGRGVGNILRNFADLMHETLPGLTLKDVEGHVASYISTATDCKPTFLNYRGFPGLVCLSVNEALVHGIPTDYVLQNGDIVTMDVGLTYEGAIADAAFTCVYGKAKDEATVTMLKACQGALDAAIKAVVVGKRLGQISSTIAKEGRRTGHGIVTLYGGHGLDYEMPHASPFVANAGSPSEGIRIQPGLAIAIEPMFVFGSDNSTKVLDDEWTVVTNSYGCHFEHSVTVDDTGQVHIVTQHNMLVEDYV